MTENREGHHIRTERDGAVGVITIDRPQRFNALDVSTARDLRQASLGFARDRAIRAVVLRGTKDVFCSGADLKYVHRGGDSSDLDYLRPHPLEPSPAASTAGYGDVFKEILEYIHSTISEIQRAPKPFVAAVEGVAAAGGFGLAMACDVVLASERATFEWAYGKTGLTGAESSTFFLPRLIGLRRSMELVLLNPRLDAKHAREIGLITAVLPDDRFDEETTRLAKRLASGPTRALGVAKGLIQRAVGTDRLDLHLAEELDQLTRIADGRDFAAGLDDFIAKRPARFEEG